MLSRHPIKPVLRFRFHSTMAKAAPVAKGDLFKYQDSLPDLPVPSLEHTLTLYKRSIIPFYPEGSQDPDYKKYCQVVDEFAKTDGPKLQQKLIEFGKGHRNWLQPIWDDYAYFGYRDPVSPFSSYFYSHKDFNNSIGKDQLVKASALTSQVLKFQVEVENETLEPELIKGNPFCMESFRWMFHNCRVPAVPSDTTVAFAPEGNRFMIVVSNGYFYKMTTHLDGKPLPTGAIFNGLSTIYKKSHDRPAADTPVGILTSSNRDVWAANYEQLIKNPINRGSVEAIQRSSFVLCLDDCFPQTIEEKSRNCWHGNGYNRWFDKPVQIFVAKNGSSGFLGEHSKMDGTPTLRMNDWIVQRAAKMKLTEFLSDIGPAFEELKFEADPAIKESVTKELAVFDKTVNSLDIKTWQYFGLGKDSIKAFKVSPDAFVQALMQLAYYKTTGTLRPTYESASTRKYFGGRTEVCRTVSQEMLQFVRDWEDPSKTDQEKIQSFRNAATAHSQYSKQAADGQGVDRHLLGLSQMAAADKKPALFTDPIYSYSSKWYLSTSQLSSSEFNGYGWSPVVPEGYGLAYMLNKDWLHVNITVHKNNPFGLRADVMSANLLKAVNEMKEVLTAEKLKAKL